MSRRYYESERVKFPLSYYWQSQNGATPHCSAGTCILCLFQVRYYNIMLPDLLACVIATDAITSLVNS